MRETGVLLVQHGDFPLDFIEKERGMYERMGSIMERLSEEAQGLPRTPENDPHGEDTRGLADATRGAGYDVEVGYLDFARPTMAEAVDALACRGHKKVVFACAPGLMMRSSHSLIDVPRKLREMRAARPDIGVSYARPGIPYQLIARAIVKKVDHALGKALPREPAPTGIRASQPGTAVVLVAHGDVPLDFMRSNMGIMKESEESIMSWSESVRRWPRSADNDPNYADTLLLKKYLLEMLWPLPLEVGYLEFAAPDVDGAFEKLLEGGVKKVVVAGGTGFFDRNSHTLIDIPEAIGRLGRKWPGVEIAYAYPDIGLVIGELTRAITFKIERALDGETMQL